MARMYSRKKGKSGSKKPIKKIVPSWLRYKPKEIEMLIIKLSKENQTPSQIGTHLRDVYGIPDVKMVVGKNITKLLKEKNILPQIPEDLMALMKKSVLIKKHMEENKQDMAALRGFIITNSKINKLVKYYKTRKVLPEEWKYDMDKIKLYV